MRKLYEFAFRDDGVGDSNPSFGTRNRTLPKSMKDWRRARHVPICFGILTDADRTDGRSKMGKELIQPIDPASAKAISDAAQFGSKAIDFGTAVGRYTASVLADLPHDMVGLVGDYVKHKRQKRAFELDQQYKKLLRDRGVENPVDPSPSIAIPLLKAAIDEDREVLRDLWARLLANACDPARKDRVRASFIELLKKLDPFDAEVLHILGTVSGQPAPNPRDYVKAQTKRSEDEVMVSFENLIELGCLSQPNTGEAWKPLMASRGRLLLAAVSA
jgi:hypothetical protein